MRRFVAVMAVGSLLSLAGPSAADDGKERLPALEADLARSAAILASGACDVACPAFASMDRAAERICAIEPGARCEAARAKVRAARHKVEGACPDCTLRKEETAPIQAKAGEVSPKPAEPQGRADPAQPPAPPQPPSVPTPSVSSAPGRLAAPRVRSTAAATRARPGSSRPWR